MPEPLTDREREVAVLASRGKSASEISRALGIEANTVKVHLHRIYSKLGIAGPRAATTLVVRATELLAERKLAPIEET